MSKFLAIIIRSAVWSSIVFLVFVIFGYSVVVVHSVYNDTKTQIEEDADATKLEILRFEVIIKDQAFTLKTQAEQIDEQQREGEQLFQRADELKTVNMDLRYANQISSDYIDELERVLEQQEHAEQIAFDYVTELETAVEQLRRDSYVALNYIAELEHTIEQLRRELDNYLID